MSWSRTEFHNRTSNWLEAPSIRAEIHELIEPILDINSPESQFTIRQLESYGSSARCAPLVERVTGYAEELEEFRRCK